MSIQSGYMQIFSVTVAFLCIAVNYQMRLANNICFVNLLSVDMHTIYATTQGRSITRIRLKTSDRNSVSFGEICIDAHFTRSLSPIIAWLSVGYKNGIRAFVNYILLYT